MHLKRRPKTETFFDDFARKARLICKGSMTLRCVAREWGLASEGLRRIQQLEVKSARVGQDIKQRLENTFVPPMDSDDIHALATRMDHVINHIHQTSLRMQIFRLETSTSPSVELTSILYACSLLISRGVDRLRRFDDMWDLRHAVRDLQKEGDRAYSRALSGLLAGGQPALTVLKWKDVYEMFEITINRCDDVLEFLQGLVVKHT